MTELELIVEKGKNHVNSLSHGGKKGMKWGYNDGKKNGKKTAGDLIKEAVNTLKRDINNPGKILERYTADKYKKEYSEAMKREPNTLEEEMDAQIERLKHVLYQIDSNMFGSKYTRSDIRETMESYRKNNNLEGLKVMNDIMIKAIRASESNPNVKVWAHTPVINPPINGTDFVIKGYFEKNNNPANRIKDRKKPGLTNSLGR